jgi:hypothetical protein
MAATGRLAEDGHQLDISFSFGFILVSFALAFLGGYITVSMVYIYAYYLIFLPHSQRLTVTLFPSLG